MARAHIVPSDPGVARLLADVLEDCAELQRFRGRKLITPEEWEHVPDATRARFLKNEYVVVSPHAVYITPTGALILQYTEEDGDGD